MRDFVLRARPLVPCGVLFLALAGCGEEATGTGGGGSGGSGGAGSSGGSGGLSGALCKQGNMVIEGTLEGQPVTLDLASNTWGYNGAGSDFAASFEGGSIGLKPPANSKEDAGEVPITGGLDLPSGMPHGEDLLCADEGSLVVCGGGGFDACTDMTYRFAFTLKKVSVAKGTGCPGTPIEGELAGCLLDTL